MDDPEVKVSIVYPGRQYLSAKTRAFIDYTLEYFGHGESASNGTSADARDEAGGVPGPALAPPGSMVTDLQEIPGI